MKNKPLIKDILIYLGLATMVSGFIFTQRLDSLDEIWIYNFARGIANGLLPYKDISMIISPLLPMICAVFLKIFGNEMIVLRGVEVLVTAAILFTIYKIMIKLNINKGISLLLAMRNISNIYRRILLRLQLGSFANTAYSFVLWTKT